MTIRITKLRFDALLAALALIIPSTAWATHVFTDVNDGAFYAAPAEWAKTSNITTGSPAGSATSKPLELPPAANRSPSSSATTTTWCSQNWSTDELLTIFDPNYIDQPLFRLSTRTTGSIFSPPVVSPPTDLRVRVTDASGAVKNSEFNLQVTCP